MSVVWILITIIPFYVATIQDIGWLRYDVIIWVIVLQEKFYKLSEKSFLFIILHKRCLYKKIYCWDSKHLFDCFSGLEDWKIWKISSVIIYTISRSMKYCITFYSCVTIIYTVVPCLTLYDIPVRILKITFYVFNFSPEINYFILRNWPEVLGITIHHTLPWPICT